MNPQILVGNQPVPCATCGFCGLCGLVFGPIAVVALEAIWDILLP